MSRAQRVVAAPTADAATTDESNAAHAVLVSPHLIVLDHQTPSATVTFSNAGESPVEADIVLQYGYTAWRDQDTVLFHPVGKAPDWILDAYDTVVSNPGPKDRYAGRWLSGAPTHVRLEGHASRSVTLRMTPPAGLANGEYYVRLVTLSHPAKQKGGKSLDTRTKNVLPVLGKGPPPPRDSVRIYYRQGPQTMRVKFAVAENQLDTTRAAEDYAEAHNLGRTPVRTLIALQLTGTAHFEGYWDEFFVTPSGQRIVLGWKNGDNGPGLRLSFVLQHDAVMRWLTQASMLPPGHYTHVLRLIPDMQEFPPDKRLPMDTVQVSMPLDIP